MREKKEKGRKRERERKRKRKNGELDLKRTKETGKKVNEVTGRRVGENLRIELM